MTPVLIKKIAILKILQSFQDLSYKDFHKISNLNKILSLNKILKDLIRS